MLLELCFRSIPRSPWPDKILFNKNLRKARTYRRVVATVVSQALHEDSKYKSHLHGDSKGAPDNTAVLSTKWSSRLNMSQHNNIPFLPHCFHCSNLPRATLRHALVWWIDCSLACLWNAVPRLHGEHESVDKASFFWWAVTPFPFDISLRSKEHAQMARRKGIFISARLVKIGYDWLRLVMHLLKSLSKSSCGSRLRNVFRDLYFYFSHFSLCSSSFVPPIRTKNGEYCDGRITSDVWTWHGYGTGQ